MDQLLTFLHKSINEFMSDQFMNWQVPHQVVLSNVCNSTFQHFREYATFRDQKRHLLETICNVNHILKSVLE